MVDVVSGLGALIGLIAAVVGFLRLGPSKGARIAFFGLDGSGKTWICHRIQGRSTNTGPTQCPHVEEFKVGRVAFRAYDLSGMYGARRVWRDYFPALDGVVFVVDAADADRAPEAAEELQKLLSCEELAGLPVLVLGNKAEAPGAMPAPALRAALRLDSQEARAGRALRHVPCSARLGEGYTEDPARGRAPDPPARPPRQPPGPLRLVRRLRACGAALLGRAAAAGRLLAGAALELLGLRGRARVLVAGLDNAGKSCLLARLQGGRFAVHCPSFYAYEEEFAVAGVRFTAFVLGGNCGARRRWGEQVAGARARGLVFVVDGADAGRAPEAAEELQKLLSCEELAGLPVLVLGNKAEAPGAMSAPALRAALRLDSQGAGEGEGGGGEAALERPLRLVACSAAEAWGYTEGFAWLARAICGGS
eukprot:tig00020554_g10851.t2